MPSDLLLGLLAGLASAAAFGVAAVLQAQAALREPPTPGVDPLLLVRQLRHPAFLAALALNLLGFLLHLAALRTLPLFLAQALVSASVVVTAALGSRVLGGHLRRREALAVGALVLGLALLTSSASTVGDVQPDAGTRSLLLAAVAAVAVAGVLAGRLHGPVGASLLGLASGLGFAVTALASRVLPGFAPAVLVVEPAAYALLVGGPLAALLYSTALQRGAVLTATSTVVLGQTVVPALVGVLALGDRLRPGTAPLAVVGLALAVVASGVLARYDPRVLALEAPRAR